MTEPTKQEQNNIISSQAEEILGLEAKLKVAVEALDKIGERKQIGTEGIAVKALFDISKMK